MSVTNNKNSDKVDYEKIVKKSDNTILIVMIVSIAMIVGIIGSFYMISRGIVKDKDEWLKNAVEFIEKIQVESDIQSEAQEAQQAQLAQLATIDNLIGQEKFDEALEMITRIEDNQTRNETLAGLTSWQAANDYKYEAIKTAKKLVESQGDYYAYNYLGWTYMEVEDYANAETYLLKSIADNDNYRLAHNNLGVVYQELGEYGLAEAQYLKAIEIEPGNPKSYYNVAIIYQNSSRIDKAIEYYLKSLKLNKSTPALEPEVYEANLWFLARQYYLIGDVKNCEYYMDLYLKLPPKAPEIFNACE